MGKKSRNKKNRVKEEPVKKDMMPIYELIVALVIGIIFWLFCGFGFGTEGFRWN